MARIMAIHHASGLGGGSASFVDILAMLRQSHEVVASCPDVPSALSSRLESESYEYVRTEYPIPIFNHYNGGSSVFSRTFWQGLARFFRYGGHWVSAIRAQRANVVIVNSSVMVLMGPIIRRAGAKSVCFVRETFPSRRRSIRTRILYLLLDTTFDGVLFISEHDRVCANLRRAHTAVVRHSARPSTFRKVARAAACESLGVPQGSFNVLYGGGASWLKGLDVALESLSYLVGNRVHLIIAGDMAPLRVPTGGLLSRLVNRREVRFVRLVKQLLARREIGAMISIVGSQPDMSDCYSAADVVIFPSNQPHQARPIFESGMYSLPVVSSDFPETRESLEDRSNGLVFEPGNALALARAISEICLDRDLAAALGEQNRLRSANLHSFELEGSNMLSFLNGLS